MDFDVRLGWLLLGMAVGFIAGYIVRALRELKEDVHEVKEELHEVDEIVKHRFDDEHGFMNNRVVADIMMLVVLVLVIGSVVGTAINNNKVTDTQNSQAQTTACTQQFLAKTIKALNERTTFSQEQAESNIELQKAQAKFLAFILRQPPYPEAQRADSAQEYLEKLTEFVMISDKNVAKIAQNPYPTNEDFVECLNRDPRGDNEAQ